MDCGLRPCPALITQVHSAAAEATVGQEAGLEGARPGCSLPGPIRVCVSPHNPGGPLPSGRRGWGDPHRLTLGKIPSPAPPRPAAGQGTAPHPRAGRGWGDSPPSPQHRRACRLPPPPTPPISLRAEAGRPGGTANSHPQHGELTWGEGSGAGLADSGQSTRLRSGRRERERPAAEAVGGEGGGEPGTDKGARKRALRLRAARRPPRGLRLRRRRAAGAGEAGARRGVALRLRGVEGGAGGRRARGSHKGGGSVRWGECACAVEVSFPLSPRLRGRETVLSLGLCSPVRWRRLWLLLLEGAGARCLWALWCFGRPEVLLEGLVCVRSPEVGVGRGRAVGLGRGLWGVEGRWFGLLQCQLVYRDLGSYHARRILWPAFWRLKDGRKALSMAEDNNAISNSFRCCRTFSPIWLGYRMKCICSTLPYS